MSNFRMVLLFSIFLLSACSGVSQEDYDATVARVTELEIKLESSGEREDQLNTDLAEVNTEFGTVTQELEVVTDELSSAKKDISGSNSEINRLQNQMDDLICEEQITDMKYGDILDASTILSGWVATQPWSS